MIGRLPSSSGNSSKYSSVASLRLATAFAPLVLELPPLRPVALFNRPILADGADLRALRDVHILFPVEHGRERPHDLTDKIASPFVVVILTDVFGRSSRLPGRVQTRVQIPAGASLRSSGRRGIAVPMPSGCPLYSYPPPGTFMIAATSATPGFGNLPDSSGGVWSVRHWKGHCEPAYRRSLY